MWSKSAPVALWPPSVSQYCGTIAEKVEQKYKINSNPVYSNTLHSAASQHKLEKIVQRMKKTKPRSWKSKLSVAGAQ